MRIERSFEVDAPLTAVWADIRDPERMVTCVPGCQAVEQVDDTTYRASVALAVGPIRATFDLNVEIETETPPTYVRTMTTGDEGSRASMVRATSEMRLEEISAGTTRVSYASDVEISGRLGRYGAGMMTKIANRKAEEFETAFCARFNAAKEEV